ncbi:MAG: response regulator, partial [Gemmatimonadota bacterium]
MTVRAFMVEDEPLARDALRELVSGVEWLEIVGEATDGAAAVELIEELKPELIFLDVNLPEISGLDVLDRLDYDPVVVFTTAYDEYAVAAFELEAIDYLLKPFGKERFQIAVDRARQALETRSDEPIGRRAREALNRNAPLSRILARHRGRIVPVELSEVRRLEAQGDYVAVHTGDQKFLVGLP